MWNQLPFEEYTQWMELRAPSVKMPLEVEEEEGMEHLSHPEVKVLC